MGVQVQLHLNIWSLLGGNKASINPLGGTEPKKLGPIGTTDPQHTLFTSEKLFS